MHHRIRQRFRGSAFATLAIVSLALAASTTHAQLRIATYNTGNATSGQTLARTGMDTVLEAIGNETVAGIARPIDVLVLQEQSSVSTSTQSFVNVLNGIYGGNDYQRGIVNGGTGGSGRMGIVYDSTAVSLIDELAFGSHLRQTLRYQLRPVGYDASADFYIYVDHYKAGDDGGDQSQRFAQAQAVRNNADALGPGASIIFAGDFNIQSSSEGMYQELTSSGNGQAFDPIDTPGTWHDSNSLRFTHTQSPAFTEQYPGQVLGGMDDRFDFQLVTGELEDNEGLSYIPGTYRAFGNNGTHFCCNSSITTGSGASTAVLEALESVSDHIPVVADYQLPAIMDVQVPSLPSMIAQGENVSLDVLVSNIANVVAPNGADELDYTLSVTGDLLGGASGIDAPLGGGNTHPVTLDTSVQGQRSGVITVSSSSQSAADALFSMAINFTVGEGGAGGPTFGVVANDLFDSNQNLGSFSQTPDTAANPFTSLADGFGVYQAGVSSSMPFALVDDSFSVFANDQQGIVDASPDSPGFKSDRWFGVVDVENNDNPSGEATATWTFDVSGATGLEVSIDMGAMGDFEVADEFNWTYSLDGGAIQPLFTSSVDEAGSATYTLADGDMFTLADPLSMTGANGQTVELSNIFQTLTTEIPGSGNELTLMLYAATNGDGSSAANHESFAFDNIVIEGFTGGFTADVDQDGDVDGDDLTIIHRTNLNLIADWNAQYGSVAAGAATVVPEPATGLLLGWMLALLFQRKFFPGFAVSLATERRV